MVISMEELCPVVTIYSSIYLKCTVVYCAITVLPYNTVSVVSVVSILKLLLLLFRKIVITGLIRGYQLDTKISINANLHWKYYSNYM